MSADDSGAHPDVHEVDQGRRTALHYAAMEGDLPLATRLLAAGADVGARESGGYTPLHFAAQYLRAELIELLVSRGAELDAEDRWGNTPLWRATFATRDDGTAVQLLLDAGADQNHVNHSGATPLELAHKIGNSSVAGWADGLS